MIPLPSRRTVAWLPAILVLAAACGGSGPTTSPSPAAVATVVLNQSDISMVPQYSVQLSATPKSSSGTALTDRTVTWQSSAAAIASVSSSGLVTGLTLGDATITATSEGKSATATVSVREGTVIGPAGGTVIAAGGNARITIPAGALATPLPISVTLLSSPPSPTGVVANTAYELGPTGTTFSAPVTLEFKYPYSGGVDSSRALYRLARYTSGSWVPLPGSSGSQTGNRVIAQTSSFSSYGIVGSNISTTLTITPQQPVVFVGQSRSFTAPTVDESVLLGITYTKQRTWRTIGGITVNAVGLVTGVSPDATARVFVADAYTFPCNPKCSLGYLNYGLPNQVEVLADALVSTASGFSDVTVALVPVKAISVTPALPQLSVAATQPMTATLKDSVGGTLATQFRTVVWTTSNSLVATVSAGGVVTAVAPGTATISASAEGITGSTLLTVTGSLSPVVTVEVTPTLPSVEVGATVPLTVTAKDAGGFAVLGRPVVWASLNPGIATVSQSGVVTGVSAGQVGISATVDGILGGSFVTVVLPYPLVVGTPAAGAAHTCFLRSNNTTWCWGGGPAGQLGNGTTTTAQLGPVQVSGGSGFTSISAGYDHTCAIGAGGQAYCWGSNPNGQLGNNSLTNSLVPAAVSGGGFAKVSAGHFHSCALTAGGAAYCWGAGGRIGDGTNVDSKVPVAVAGGHSFSAIAAGSNATCGLAGGAVWCWGNGLTGELGNGTNVYDPVALPVQVSGGQSFTKLVGGQGDQFCGLTSGGDAYCWGRGTEGQLGDGSLVNRNIPVGVATSVKFTAISAGAASTCALAVDGTAWCWGLRGDLGSGLPGLPLYVSTPVAVTGGHLFTEISTGGGHSCARAADGTWCWGMNSAGQLGTGTDNGGFISFLNPVKVRFP